LPAQELLFKLTPLSEIEFGTWKLLMEDRHNRKKHLRANIRVKLHELFQIHVRFFSESTLQKLLDVFLIFVPLFTV